MDYGNTDYRPNQGLRDIDDVIRGSRFRDQRKVTDKGIRNPDYDGLERIKPGFRNKKRPSSNLSLNPPTDHFSGPNPEDAVYYDDFTIDDAGDDYKDHSLGVISFYLSMFLEYFILHWTF